jgi:Na+/proline symporter
MDPLNQPRTLQITYTDALKIFLMIIVIVTAFRFAMWSFDELYKYLTKSKSSSSVSSVTNGPAPVAPVSNPPLSQISQAPFVPSSAPVRFLGTFADRVQTPGLFPEHATKQRHPIGWSTVHG